MTKILSEKEALKFIDKPKIEAQRKFWMHVARQNQWYADRIKKNPKHKLFIQIWMNDKGEVRDSIYRPETAVGDLFVLEGRG